MLSLKRQHRRAPLVSLTPLIDVVFILLVFFMLASSFSDWRHVDLKLGGRGGAASPDEKVMLLRLHADGTADLNGQPVTLEGAAETVAARADGPPKVLIIPAEGVPVQGAVDALQALNRAGVHDVALAR